MDLRFILNNETSTAPSQSSMNVRPQIEMDPLGALEERQYKVIRQLDEGAYAGVFLVVDHAREYAVKLQWYDPEEPMLRNEMQIIQRIYCDPRTHLPSVGVPTVHEYMIIGQHEFLVMGRLGESLLDKMLARPSRAISKKTALMIGIQIVRRIQILHGKHVLHRDIKPGNFVMGLGAAEQTVYIIDFGLSTIVEDWGRYDPTEYAPCVGTKLFAAAETLYETKPTRAGDLQSLVYTLIYLVGGLKWKDRDENGKELGLADLAKRRFSRSPADLCAGFPELTKFAQRVFNITCVEAPNYDLLVRELEYGLESMGFQNDRLFDWLVEQKGQKRRKRSVRRCYHRC